MRKEAAGDLKRLSAASALVIRAFSLCSAAGGCPTRALSVGDRMTQVVKIRNTGSKRWPATFVVLDGTSDFTTDRVVDDHGVDGVNMGVSEYAFDGLAPGQTKTIVAGYTAKRAGNDDITIGAWGDKPSSDGAPSEMPANTQSLDCQVAINP